MNESSHSPHTDPYEHPTCDARFAFRLDDNDGPSFAGTAKMTTPSDTVSFAPAARDMEPPSKVARYGRSSAGSPPQAAGTLWFAGWLFTIGFAKLVWWKAILALVAWPYFLGVTIR